MLFNEIPDAKPYQLGIFDQFVDRTELARDAPHVPLSERAILRLEEGSDSSGNRRALFGEELDQLLVWFFRTIQEAEGWDSAVLCLFKNLARDEEYHRHLPPWAKALFESERDLLFSAFWSNSCQIEPGDSDDEEGEEEPCFTESVLYAVAA
jgi:hypothetical protein